MSTIKKPRLWVPPVVGVVSYLTRLEALCLSGSCATHRTCFHAQAHSLRSFRTPSPPYEDNCLCSCPLSCLTHTAPRLLRTPGRSLLPQTYQLFDNILLMGEGKITYHGPREGIVPYFNSLG